MINNQLQSILQGIYNDLQPRLQWFTMVYKAIYNDLQPNYIQLQDNLQPITIDIENNYNIVVIESSVLCTMACRQRLRDC